MLAICTILHRLYLGKDSSFKRFPKVLAPVFACAGMIIFGMTGIIPLFLGGSFLDYSYLAIPGVHGAELRYLGILIVEIGIAMAVFGTLVLIFDNLVGERW